MEKNHPVSELMAETIQKIKEAVDANTVVGQPITAGEVTIIPVSRISLGFGTGGSEFGGKAPKNLGEFRLPLHYSRKTVLKAVYGLSP